MNSIDQKLLKRLIRKKLVTDNEAEALEARFDSCQGDLFHKLLPMKIVDDRELAKSYAKVCGLPFLDVRKVKPEGEILRLLAEKKSHQYQAIPIGYAEKKLIVAIINASNVVELDKLRLEFNDEVQFVITLPTAMNELLSQLSRLRASKLNIKIDSTTVRSDTEPNTHDIDSRDTMLEKHYLKPEKNEDSFYGRETVMESDANETFHAQETIHSQETVMEEARKSSAEISTRFNFSSSSNKPVSSGAVPKVSGEKSLLQELINRALTNRADEIEIDFSRLQCIASMHLDGYWAQMSELSRTECTQLIADVRQRVKDEDIDAEGNCRLAKMEFESNRVFHRFLVTIFTIDDKSHVRILIPSNVNILQRPIRLLSSNTPIPKLQEILDGKTKGLILLSAKDEMVCWQILNSVVFQQTITGDSQTAQKPEIASWRISLNIPKLNESISGGESDLKKLIDSIIERDEKAGNSETSESSSKHNSLLVCHHTPSQAVLESLLPALKNRSVLTCLTARQPESALSVLTKILLQKELTDTPIIHVHLWREPKLCTNCVELRDEVPKELPEWFQDIDAHEFYEAQGCVECGQSGRKGNNWVAEVSQSTLGNLEDKNKIVQARATAASLIKSAQIDIQDLIDDPYFFPI